MHADIRFGDHFYGARIFARFVFTGAALFLTTSAAYAIQLAASTFDTGDEGWRVSGDAQSANPTFLATGGNPGGFIRGFDDVVGGVWRWTAPAKFLGNMSAAYGFPLTYDLRMRGSGPLFGDSDVVLTGAGTSLYLIRTPPVPQDVLWTSYSALIQDTAGWHVGAYDGPIATSTQIKTVLAALTALQIRGEFISGADNGDLDSIVLNGGLPGDFNENRAVDAADYVVWQKAAGTSDALPNDGGLGVPIVDSHYNLWRNNFGTTAAASAVSVPEPTMAMLVAVMLTVLATLRRSVRLY